MFDSVLRLNAADIPSEMALSAITDAYGKGPDHAERMRGCTKVVQLMLRTWSGALSMELA